MVKAKEDMTGWKMWEHGVPDSKMIIIKQADDYISPSGSRKTQWICECSCAKHSQFIAIGQDIKCGKTKSCGCLHDRQASTNGKNNRKYNKVILNLEDEYGQYGIGYCHNTGNKFYFDMDDYTKIQQYCWREHVHTKTDYHACEAQEHISRKLILMHWIVAGKYYDHIDRNPLNNRKYNLRPATRTENARNRNKQKNNTSGFIGVYWSKKNTKWAATIVVHKKKIYLGYFSDKTDAIKARLTAELEYFREFAPQAHLFEQYGVKEMI